MAIHVKDPETGKLVRELAQLRGTTITATIREAVREALEADRKGGGSDRHLPLSERLKSFFDRIDRLPRNGVDTSKAHSDRLWGQEDW